MLILLDSDDAVVAALDFDEPPHEVLHSERVFVYEDSQGDDFIYREVVL